MRRAREHSLVSIPNGRAPIGSDGEVCSVQTVGLLQRHHLQAVDEEWIGKESDRTEDMQSGLVHKRVRNGNQHSATSLRRRLTLAASHLLRWLGEAQLSLLVCVRNRKTACSFPPEVAMRRTVLVLLFGGLFVPANSPLRAQSILVQVSAFESGQPIQGAFVTLLDVQGKEMPECSHERPGSFPVPYPGAGRVPDQGGDDRQGVG